VNVEQWPLDRLIEYARNPRRNDHAVEKVAAAIHEFGFRVPILAKSDGLVIDGHLRLKAARKLGLETVPVILADDMTDNQVRAFRLSVNKMADLAEWDEAMLALEVSALQLEDFDLDLLGFDPGELDLMLNGDGLPSESSGADDDTYSRKIQAPIYEIKGDKPDIDTLVDTSKADELTREINAADIPGDIADFLRHAAQRHTVFHFGRIAEYYAHASVEIQDLMERSALVIIDFDKAIENGFVHMTERLGELVDLEESDA
jgi:hypothetical protein